MSTLTDSALEARASIALAPFGIVRDASLLPVSFYDGNGAPFRARADFKHAPTGVLFEIKHSRLNATTTQASAANKRRTWRGPQERYKQLECDWNHSATKLATVQVGMAHAGAALVPVFMNEPDAETVGRLNRNGTFYLVHGSPGWANMLRFLKLRASGIPVTLTYSADGVPVHEFR